MPAMSTPDMALSAKIDAERKHVDTALSTGSTVPISSYVDGGMHPSFRAMLESKGAKSMAAATSSIKYPVSRPDAALADPYKN